MGTTLSVVGVILGRRMVGAKVKKYQMVRRDKKSAESQFN